MGIKQMVNSIKRALTRPRVEVFVRSCNYSSASAHKARPPNFSRKRCVENLLSSCLSDSLRFTFVLDTHFPAETPHFFTQQSRYPVVTIDEGTEAGSFLRLLEYVESRSFSADTILYFVEDDYLHKQGWDQVLLEAFTLPFADYVTLYDHRDKYEDSSYEKLTAKLACTASCHWRVTPSTTNTYAMRMGTLARHMPLHRQFSTDRKISADHEKFCALSAQGSLLVSSIPGWSTHMEPAFLSPCVDWEKVAAGSGADSFFDSSRS